MSKESFPISATRTSASLLRRALGPIACALLFLAASPAAAQPDEEPTPPAVTPPEGEADIFSYGATGDEGDGTATSIRDGGDATTAGATRPRIERARLVGKPGHRWNRGTRRVITDAARAEFSRQGDWIAYDKPSERGQRALYVSLSDGDSERCLSCDWWDHRNANVLSPTWHPGGQYLVAMVQGVGRKLDMDTKQLASPARGLHSDLWAFTRDGKDAWQI
ncbi:MAG: hypothetical protein AAFY88_32195, partial [Acidobacteriota bacterium]